MSQLSRAYWNERALTFGGTGSGLGAVASYGMPWYYNRSIDLLQWLALRPWIHDAAGRTVLDVGCGIGRWSRRFVRGGARVTGMDPSFEMIVEARRRTAAAGLDGNCRFVVGDAAGVPLRARFDRVIAVTVLQHIVSDDSARMALVNLKRTTSPGGRLLLMEVSPERPTDRCDGAWFQVRSAARYRSLFADAGLRLVSATGVDPTPVRRALLPHYRSLPRPLAQAMLFAATAAATPLDALLGRLLARQSWHTLWVLDR